MISKAKAANLGVRYKSGTEGTSNPILEAFDINNPGGASDIDCRTIHVANRRGRSRNQKLLLVFIWKII